jgi:hypothetical protein
VYPDRFVPVLELGTEVKLAQEGICPAVEQMKQALLMMEVVALGQPSTHASFGVSFLLCHQEMNIPCHGHGT